jgi:hypothetical protein
MQVLLGSVVDSWDKLRETASEALMALPAPLPGLEAPAQVAALLQWARKLVASPRVRESDAGAPLSAPCPLLPRQLSCALLAASCAKRHWLLEC